MEWEYYIVEASMVGMLRQTVADFTHDGWMPVGGITKTLNEHHYLQALVKPKKAQPDLAYLADQLQKLDEKVSAICVTMEA